MFSVNFDSYGQQSNSVSPKGNCSYFLPAPADALRAITRKGSGQWRVLSIELNWCSHFEMNFTVLLLVNSAYVKESICQLARAHKCRQHFLQLARLNDRHKCVCVCVPWFLKRQLTVLTGPQRSHIHKDTPAQRCLGCATKLPASVQHFDIVGLWLCVSAQCMCE